MSGEQLNNTASNEPITEEGKTWIIVAVSFLVAFVTGFIIYCLRRKCQHNEQHLLQKKIEDSTRQIADVDFIQKAQEEEIARLESELQHEINRHSEIKASYAKQSQIVVESKIDSQKSHAAGNDENKSTNSSYQSIHRVIEPEKQKKSNTQPIVEQQLKENRKKVDAIVQQDLYLYEKLSTLEHATAKLLEDQSILQGQMNVHKS